MQNKLLLTFILIIFSLSVKAEWNEDSLIVKAKHFSDKGFTNLSLRYYDVALKQYRKQNDSLNLATALLRKSVVLRKSGNYVESAKHAFEGLTIWNNLNNTLEICKSHISIGHLYYRQKLFTEANKEYDLAKNISEKYNHSKQFGDALHGKANILSREKRFDKAFSLQMQALKVYKKNNLQEKIGIIYINIGRNFIQQKEFELAKTYNFKALKILSNINDYTNIAICYNNIANIFYYKKEYLIAIEYYKKSISIKKKCLEIYPIELAYKNISKTYNVLHDTRNSLKYFSKYDSLIKTTRKKAHMEAMSQYRTIYETELKEKENKILQVKNKAQQEWIWWISGASFLSILLLSFVLYSYKMKQQRILEIAKKDKEIFEAKTSELLKEQELKSISSMLEGQEEERKRIAQDLHDRLGSMLSTVKLHFDSLEEKMDNLQQEGNAKYKRALGLLDEACGEVRKIAHNMVSGVLMKFGLEPALMDLKDTIEATGKLKMEVITYGLDNRLENKVEINLYRVVQELVGNAIKHAKASTITIQLNKSDDNLNIMVEDDGVGFDPTIAKHGMGLSNIKSRIHKLGGEFTIDSGKDAGTTTIIDLPLL